MKKLIALFIGLMLFSSTGFSQKQTAKREDPKQKQGHCATDNLHISLTEQSSSYKRKLEEMNANYQKWAMEKSTGNKVIGGGNSTQAYRPTTLPVIFHMMVNTTTSSLNPTANPTDGNLTKTQIQNALTVLNDLFAGTANGSKPAGINTDIQFCLAEVDNFGNAITSYTYTDPSFTTPLNNNNQPQITALSNFVQSTNRFPPTKYINIYVVEDIAGTVAGFAYMPPAHGSSFDGIYIEAQYLLDPGVPNDLPFNMTVLTHEMGHYLGMFHTFGICTNIFYACSCNNNNCLFDGDMVCDTPPDFSQSATTNCTTTANTCTTDIATIGDNLNLTSDVNDLIDNYMDYGDWNCQYLFTAGQIKRMHFMIDDTIGPRNSLLNSSVCNSVCANSSCTVSVNSITTTTVNSIQLINSLILSGPSVNYTFTGTTCSGFYDTFVWSVVDQSNNTVIQTFTGTTLPATFTAVGNYQILLTSSIATTSPLCFQTASLNIQVLPVPNCPKNLDMSLGWNSGNWERIQYEGGWSHTTNNSPTFTHPTTTLTTLAGTVPNGTAFTDPFSFTNTITGDPNFSTAGLPFPGANIMRVGRLITATTALPQGDANYVTYTFSPTSENARIRVYYLGMKEQDFVSPAPYMNQFASNAGAKSGFGFVCNYNFTNGFTPPMTIDKGLTHTGSNTWGNFCANDMVTDIIHQPTSFAPVTIGTSTFDVMSNWEFMDLDFSEFVCAAPTITITFFARADEATLPGILHSYAYFAAQCLPAIEPHIDVPLTNKDIACMADVGQSCVKQTLPPPNPYTFFENGWDSNYQGFIDVDVEESNDNISYTNTAIPLLFQYNVSLNQFEPYLNLCKTPDVFPYKYFKITYRTLCQTITNTVSIFQGFVHSINDCAPNPMSGGHYTAAPIPIGSVTISPDQYQQFCTTTTLSIGDPCWLHPGDPTPQYQWEFMYGPWTAIPNATMATLPLPDPFHSYPCTPYRRLAKYNDPYCNVPTWIPSDIIYVTDYSYNYFSYVPSGPDVCGNSLATFSITNFYEPFDYSCDLEVAAQTATAPVTNTISFQFFSNSSCSPTCVITPTAGPSVLTYTYLNALTFTNNIDLDFTFNNTGIFTANGTIYGVITVTRFGCTSTYTINNIPIKIRPSAIAGTIAASSTVCTNSTYTITGDDPNATGYYWEFSYSPTFVPTLTVAAATSSNLVVPPGTFTTYPVYVRRVANGTIVCPDPAFSNTLTINGALVSVTISPSSTVICAGASVTLSASGATSYTWASPSGTSTLNPFVTTPTVSTIYTVTGMTSGCTDTRTVSIIVNPTPTIGGIASSTICLGSSVNYTATGAVSYTWTSASSSSTLNPITLSPTVTTVYTVTGQSASGCIGTKTINVTVLSAPVLTVSASSSTICSAGSSTLTASGATSYTWTTPSGTSTLNPITVNPTVTTVYTVTGQNASGCKATATIQVIVSPAPTLTLTPSASTICAGMSETLTASGAMSYTWSSPSATTIVNPWVVTPTVTTVYTVTGANSFSCSSTQTMMITVNPTPTLTGAISGTNICSGSCVTATLNGGVTYTITAPSFTTNANPATLCPSVTTTYTASTTNSLGCTHTRTITIVVSPSPTVSISPSSSTICAGMSETLTASGASSYQWSSSTSTTTSSSNPLIVTPTVTTTYTVVGTNAEKCADTETITITVNPTPTLSGVSSATICKGASVSYTAGGASSYTWTSASSSSTLNPIVFTPTITTAYTLTGVNAFGCTTTLLFTITVLPTPTVTASASVYTICAGQSSTLTAGGAANYTWTTPSGTTSVNPITVTPSVTTTYTVTGLLQGSPCPVTQTITITVKPTPTVSISGSTVICIGDCNILTASGGGTYSWSPGGQTTSTICAGAGVSSVVVTGTNGCTATKTINVIMGTTPTITATASIYTICAGATTTLTAGGASSYTWTAPGYTSTSNPVVVSPTVTTTYTATGTSGNYSCPGTKTITIVVKPKPSAAISGATVICSGCTTLTASGGGTYTWSTGSTLTAITSCTPAGPVSVTVTGVNGCTAVATVTTVVGAVPSITISATSLSVCPGSTTALTASGATTYTWTGSDGFTSTSNPAVVSPTTDVTYTVTGQLQGGCIGTQTINIYHKKPPPAAISGATAACGPFTTTLTASGGISYQWSTGAGSPTTAVSVSSPSTAITVTVWGANGCTATATSTLYCWPIPSPTITGATSICAGSTTTLTSSSPGSFGSYLWSTGSTAASITTSLAGVYTVTLTNLFGCKGSKSVTVTILPLPTANITGSLQICPGQPTTLTATGGGTYLWHTGATTATLLVNTTGVKTVTVTGVNGCKAVKSVTVTMPHNCPDQPDLPGSKIIGSVSPVYIYPNPTTQSFNVGNASNVIMVEIFDYTGKLLKQVQKAENVEFNEIDIRPYVQGTYFIRVVNTDNSFSLFKLIKD